MEPKITLHCLLLSLLVQVLFLNCDSSTSPDEPTELEIPFAEVGQEWQYARWEKRYSGDRTFSGDTLSLSIIVKDAGIITFYERRVNADPISPADTATICFRIERSFLRQVGTNRSRMFGLFGFLPHHDGILRLSDNSSNRVNVDFDSSLFLIHERTGKGRFSGHSDSVKLFIHTYRNVIVYYDDTPTATDGAGHLALLTREEGLLATIYFGGFSPFEQVGYQLIRGRKE